MNARTESWLDVALRLSPAQPFFHWTASRKLAVLAYHGVDQPERFEEHLDVLRRTAYVVSLEEALDVFEGRRSLPRRAVLITFDDGHRSVLDVGMPMLRERGLPAVVFVVAGVVDTDRPFWWAEVEDLVARGGSVRGMSQGSGRQVVSALKRASDDERRAALEELRGIVGPTTPMAQLTGPELRTLESAGVAVGNHAWSHPCLGRCSDTVLRREIEDAHAALTSILGHPPHAFAYPDGQYDPRAADVLGELGYRAAFVFDHRLSDSRPRDPLAVSRLRVNSTTTLDRFQTIASGLHPAIHRARGGG
jgi:peptidoglycan/xylan/chitin deacetylase (PgdA/CDA1 family)